MSLNIESSSKQDTQLIEIGKDDKFSFREFLTYVGPGFLVSMGAFLDPGNVFGAIQAGVIGGYSLLWVLLTTTFFGYMYQKISARIGTVTNVDLACLCRMNFSKPVTLLLWLMAEIAIIVADIQEVVGTSIALWILFGFPLWLGILCTVVDSFLLLLTSEAGQRKLEMVFAFFIFVMAFAFVFNLGYIGVDWGQAAKGLVVPILRQDTIEPTMSLIGAIITLHTLYLHSSLVLTRQIDRQNTNAVRMAIQYFNLESSISLGVAFIISAVILCTFVRWRNYSEELDLRKAGIVLKEAFGDKSEILWGIGLFASGQASTMAGALSGQYVMQGYLNLQLKPWIRIMITRALAITPAFLTLLFSEVDSLVQTLNIIQLIQIPFVVVPLLRISSSVKMMGEFALKTWEKWLLIPVFVLLLGFNVYGMVRRGVMHGGIVIFAMIGYAILYLAMIAVITFAPMKQTTTDERTQDSS
eukprot:TRINITY_DN3004_c0_g1_i3.p1 TRINITY_DN3004_c0_g1~~TRINITY_DN3004_c0_g1_i3.p1  ORF type:complete len:469 (-),score=62.98 TRINITY_DN3004_c0_g1_i3:87-1493(-)